MGSSTHRIEMLLIALVLLITAMLAIQPQRYMPDVRIDLASLHADPSTPAIAAGALIVGAGGLLFLLIRHMVRRRLQVRTCAPVQRCAVLVPVAIMHGVRRLMHERSIRLTAHQPRRLHQQLWLAMCGVHVQCVAAWPRTAWVAARRLISVGWAIGIAGYRRIAGSLRRCGAALAGHIRHIHHVRAADLPMPSACQHNDPYVMAPPPVTVPDLVLSAEAAATALAAAWRTLELRGRLTALDVRRGGRVLAHIEPAPGDEAALTLLPGTLANSGHAARWHRSILQLTSGVPGAACRDLLLAPLLDHPQQHNGRRFVALSWPTVSGIERRHLILTGTHAVDVLHSVLIGMLYSMPPDDLALSVVGDPAIAAIYRTTPHWVEAPESAAATLETLHRCLRRPHGRSAVRPLVCVLIDPDAATLAACLAIIPRIGSASLHLFLVCRTPRAALAQIDAIRLQLNEQRRLPHAELRIGSLRSTGHVRRLDHAAAVSLAAALPPVADLPLRPVVWQVPVPMLPTETSMPADLLAQLVAALVPATAPQLRWPVGPAGITPAILAALVDGLCQAPGIVAATPAGVTRRRLAALLAPEHRHAAALLFDWFDAAGVLVPPRSEELRLREPRMLCSHDRHWIADQLSCTPLPTREAQ